MRVLLSTYGSRGDVEPVVGLAVRLRELGAEVRVCAPPDEEFAQRLAGVDVPLVPVGRSARTLTTAATPPSPASLPARAAELIADLFPAVTAAAEGCDALVATGLMPAAAGALSVAEKRTSRTGPAGWPRWASARHTTARRRPPSPCQPRSERP
ncbi:glycosyltransferase [Nonomuraea sp. NPDC050383]|uniref:glycosyltransferase n=1 Tax=Nonomuraea sp. NPDC050383 TaxID=3364362 RepID=UPI003795CC6A